MEAIIQGTTFEVVDQIKFPDQYRRKMEVFGQNMLDIRVNSDEVSLSSQGRKQDLVDSDKEVLQSLPHEKFMEYRALNNDFDLDILGMNEFEGIVVYVVFISDLKVF